MDPDSWPIFEAICASALMIPLYLCAGVVGEQSTQKEISASGVGVSLQEIAARLLCAIPTAWAACSLAGVCGVIAAAVLRPLTDPAASAFPPVPYAAVCTVSYILLALFTASLCAALPLSWGRAHSDGYVGKLRLPLLLVRLFVPVARLVTFPARRALRARGMADDLGSVTEEDVLDDVEELNDIDASQKEMIGNIFELADVRAGDIMTHRTEVEAVSLDASVEDIVEKAVAFGYSRIPVYEGTLDNIVGIAFVKDLLPYVGRQTGEFRLRRLLRKALYVPESCRARELLIDFRNKHMQLAVVVDEYGGTAGIVSMEDILESIVGDIEDEYDEEEKLIMHNHDGTLTCDGYAEVDDVYEALGLDEPPEDIESDTIGGLLTALLGRIPKKDEHPSRVYDDTLELTALRADERRITGVAVRRLSPKAEN